MGVRRIGTDGGLRKDVWEGVVAAIEDALPVYDKINQLISFGRAEEARQYAINQMGPADGLVVLDSGVGPGNNSRIILSRNSAKVLVGLDESAVQLENTKRNLKAQNHEFFHLVRGSFEFLPFRGEVFDWIITSYALRDTVNLSQTLGEYSRVSKSTGRFTVVDIGKPDNYVKRTGSLLYVRFVMPLIARLAMRNKIKPNPWRMIWPTYVHLPTNRQLARILGQWFGPLEVKEFLTGGVIILSGRKRV